MKRSILFDSTVPAEWIDEFGHMGYLDYQRAADVSTMAFWAAVNDGRGQEERAGAEFVIADIHVRYARELRLEDRFQIATILADHDEKRMLLLHEIMSGETLCATVLLLCLSFNLNDRRVRPFARSVLDRFAGLVDRDAFAVHPLRGCMSLPPRRG